MEKLIVQLLITIACGMSFALTVVTTVALVKIMAWGLKWVMKNHQLFSFVKKPLILALQDIYVICYDKKGIGYN